MSGSSRKRVWSGPPVVEAAGTDSHARPHSCPGATRRAPANEPGDGHTTVSAPIDGPFGRTFAFADPDGYQVTLHDRA